MKRLAALGMALAGVAAAPGAAAQGSPQSEASSEPAPPAPPPAADLPSKASEAEPKTAAPSKAADTDTDEDANDADGESGAAQVDDDLEEEEEEDTEPRLPPPGPPHPGDQKPAPVLEHPRPIGPLRHVEVGGIGGAIARPSVDSRATYNTGWTAGGYVRIEGERFWGLRLNARQESSSGAAEAPTQRLEMKRVYIGVLAEPTWTFTDRLAVWIALGIGWGRTKADAESEWTVRERSGVFLEIPIGIGIGYELVPDWLRLSVSGNVGVLTLQSGSLFEPVQAIDASGMLTTAPALPEFATSWGAVAGLGVLL